MCGSFFSFLQCFLVTFYISINNIWYVGYGQDMELTTSALSQILSQFWSLALRTVPHFVCKVIQPFREMSVLPDKQRVMCGKLNGLQKPLAKHLQGSSSPSPVLHFNLVWPGVLVHLQSFNKITGCESLPAHPLLPCPDQHSKVHKNRKLGNTKNKPLAKHQIPSMPVLSSAQHRF